MEKETGHIYQFGRFRVDAVTNTLFEEDRRVPLRPKTFELLRILVENSGHVLEKDALLKRLWPDSFVEEANLTQNIYTLRKTLGEGANEHRYIETIPKRGYRFVASVRELRDETTAAFLGKTSAIWSPDLTEKDGWTVETSKPGLELVRASVAPAILPAFSRRSFGARRPVRATTVVLLAITASTMLLMPPGKPKQLDARASIKSIAVLPFKPLGDDNADEYLGAGMADALITKLGNIDQIAVRPTSAVRKYNSMTNDPITAGREQRVESVLEGSIQRLGDRLRVTVQLVRVGDGRPLWAGKFDERFSDIFRAEDSISERVAEALMLGLTGDQKKRLNKHYTEDLQAHQAYLKGRYYCSKRTPEGIQKAIQYFQEAIDADPDYALAYSGLADSYKLLGFAISPLPPAEIVPKAKQAAERALEIDDTLAEARASLADIRRLYDWDWESARREFKQSIELNPNYPTAHQWYSLSLAATGRFDEASREIAKAQELDPVSLVIGSDAARIFYYSRQYDRAIEQCAKTLELDQNFWPAIVWLGLTYQQKGMQVEALSSFQKALAVSGSQNLVATTALAQCLARLGRTGEAKKMLRELEKNSEQSYISPYYIAMIHVALGQKDQALSSLERAYEERSSWLAYIGVDPMLDSLRRDPRFDRLTRAIGFIQ